MAIAQPKTYFSLLIHLSLPNLPTVVLLPVAYKGERAIQNMIANSRDLADQSLCTCVILGVTLLFIASLPSFK